MNYDQFLKAVNAPETEDYVTKKDLEAKYNALCRCVLNISGSLTEKNVTTLKPNTVKIFKNILGNIITLDEFKAVAGIVREIESVSVTNNIPFELIIGEILNIVSPNVDIPEGATPEEEQLTPESKDNL